MRSIATCLLGGLALAACAGSGGGETTGEAPAVGDPAPAFRLPGSDGQTHDLAGLSGRAVVLAWFPKAFTGG